MPQLVRHEISATLLRALRQEGLGVRDLFEGRQEPLSWFFRLLAYDQAELDFLESGAVETLHAPSALVELALDELALALANVETEGLAEYLRTSSGQRVTPETLDFEEDVILGFLNVDVAPPALWLEERESTPAANERLAGRLTTLAEAIGGEANAVEVHIEGALHPAGGWSEPQDHVRPAGVSVHFGFEIPLAGTGERELAHLFARGARVAAAALEHMRDLFRERG